jgi:hypothetical protein
MWPFPKTPNYQPPAPTAPAPSPAPPAAVPPEPPDGGISTSPGAMCWVPPWATPPYESAPEPGGFAPLLHTVNVAISAPGIPATQTRARGDEVIVTVPTGARTYEVWTAYSNKEEPNALPVELVEPSSGTVDGAQLKLTPYWQRLGKAHVERGDVSATLFVLFR